MHQSIESPRAGGGGGDGAGIVHRRISIHSSSRMGGGMGRG